MASYQLSIFALEFGGSNHDTKKITVYGYGLPTIVPIMSVPAGKLRKFADTCVLGWSALEAAGCLSVSWPGARKGEL